MDQTGTSHPPRGGAPHIRLNSGTQDPFQDDNAQHNRPGTSRRSSARSLTSRVSTRQRPAANPFYQAPAESTELLLPPKRSRIRRFRDEESPARSPEQSPGPSGFSSRRTSLSSEYAGSRNSLMGRFESPFDDSRSPSRTGSDDEDVDVNTQTVSEKYNIQPSAGLLLFPEDVEKDDYLHNPDPSGREDRDCDVFTSRGLVNIGGLALITLGLMALFIGYPVLYAKSGSRASSVVKWADFTCRTFVERFRPVNPCSANPMCIDVGPVPLLKNIRAGLIDPDTPESAMSRKARDGTKQVLMVFPSGGRTIVGC